jgi:spoIIIJ-associated protein
MEELEISGKNVDQAIKKALSKLGVSREQVDVVILNEGSPGIIGLGAEEARILVRRLDSDESDNDAVIDSARDVLGNLLNEMGIEATVAQTDNDPITFNIKGDDLGILIGRRGQTLASLQYLVRIIVSYQIGDWYPIIIDVDGYKQRRYQALQALAMKIADQVKSRKMPFSMEPMPAYERRIIHLALAGNSYVTTQSIGLGEARKVVIVPRESNRNGLNG